MDLALLQVDICNQRERYVPDGPVLWTEKYDPPVGTTVFAHGYPASRLRGPAMTSGIICGIADGLGIPNDNNNDKENLPSDDATMYVVTNAAMSGGMSGGPLVDGQGRVVGVNALVRPDLRALGNYAVSSMEVLTFLQQAKLRIQKNSQRADDMNEESKESMSTKTIVWLYNDPMNKKQRVSSIVTNIVADLNETSANDIMMQAHKTGRGQVASFATFEEAANIGQSLRDRDLLVEWETMEE